MTGKTQPHPTAMDLLLAGRPPTSLLRSATEEHKANVQSLLFGASTDPSWLSEIGQRCRERYAGIALTEDFQAALHSLAGVQTRQPFELFVVGEGKFGKSTLVNCLLGEELSQVRTLPETRCFLRYVLKEHPSQEATLYVRRDRGQHDWLNEFLGDGEKVESIAFATRHKVSFSIVKKVLAGETERLDQGGYRPAILEAERDVQRHMRSPLPGEVRVVDTQGLDQLFPDELNGRTASMSDKSSREAFLEWMKTSTRGKYLEWQFRRCDSVLWCINAKRLGSAATSAAFNYFQQYSKKIIVALTSYDLVVRCDRDLQRLLDHAHDLYHDKVAHICPINGEAAWRAIAAGDDRARKESRFDALVSVLDDLCIRRGDEVRNLSRYAALKQTERQFRGSLRNLHDTYLTLAERCTNNEEVVRQHCKSLRTGIARVLTGQLDEYRQAMSSGVDSVGLADDAEAAAEKMGIRLVRYHIQTTLSEVFSDIVVPALREVADDFGDFRLPSFDADGKVSGSCIRVDTDVRDLEWEDPTRPFEFELPSKWLADIGLRFLEFFGSKAAQAKRLELLTEQQHHVRTAFKRYWMEYRRHTLRKVDEEIDRLHERLLQDVLHVRQRLEEEAGAPLPFAAFEIEQALKAFAVRPLVAEAIRRAIQHRDSATNSGQSYLQHI